MISNSTDIISEEVDLGFVLCFIFIPLLISCTSAWLCYKAKKQEIQYHVYYESL